MLLCHRFDQSLNRVGMVPVLGGTAVLRRNAVSTFTLDVDGDNPLTTYAPGDHLMVVEDGVQVVAGRILSDEVNGTSTGTDVALTCTEHMGYLTDRITLPTPNRAVDQQDIDGYYTAKGTAEALICDLVRLNVGQGALAAWKLPITVDASQGRGGTTSVNTRFKTVLEEVQTLANVAGLTVYTWMDKNKIRFSVTKGRDLSRAVRLSQANGALGSYTLTRTAPATTSVLVAGQGQGAARYLKLVSGNTNDWGQSVLAFQDRRDTNDSDELIKAGKDTLADNAEGASISTEIVETPALRFGRDYQLGDTITVQLANGVTITDTVQQAEITWDENGRTVKLTVGQTPDDDNQDPVVAEVRRLRKALATLATT